MYWLQVQLYLCSVGGLCFLFPLLRQSASQMAKGQLLPGSIMFCPFSFISPQFLCLKNIRTFLSTCYEKFGLKRSELFEAFDLFDVQDFGKVSWDGAACELDTENPKIGFQFISMNVYTGQAKAYWGRTGGPDQTVHQVQRAWLRTCGTEFESLPHRLLCDLRYVAMPL